MSVEVSVPASAANLGPGFDSFGLAVGLYNQLEGELADEWRLEIGGEGVRSLQQGPDNLVVRAMARAFAEAGEPGLKADIYCHNGIPVGRGLGSSAAAIVGGLVLGDALTGSSLGRRRLFELAVEIEGHADNVAAALYGGFTVSAMTPTGPVCACVDPADGLAALVVLGQRELPTIAAREALPDSVPHADAAANAGKAALLALGLSLGVREFVTAGLHDAIHEQYRAALVPDLDAVRSLLDAIGAGPAVLSGAGPTVISLVPDVTDVRALERARALGEVARTALAEIGRGIVLALPIDRTGTHHT